MYKFVQIIVLITFCSSLLFANDNDVKVYKKHQDRVLKEVVVRGLEKTERSIVVNELDVKKGQKLTVSDLLESYNRLFNLRIFSQIKYDLKKVENQQSILEIEVKERWTLIPIAKVLSGGGSTQITLGAFDINLLG
ncbi:MAG: hypothetical protein MJK18_04940, partial [Bdellovibrionales bacterium]|nr:hypothetical protein [Bdellovibrionales bacterium]